MSAASVPVVLHRRRVAAPAFRRVRRGAGRTGCDPRPPRDVLVDRFGRVHRALRISVTDRCNLRCVYCMAEGGMRFRPPEELLTFDEIERVARVARGMGVTSVRLTGGEPLLRPDLPDLVARLASLGFAELSLTTNGMALADLARPLAEAGLQRVNVSCDSLRPRRFADMRRGGDLDQVLASLDAAEVAGLVPLKVNVVLIAGWNDDEIVDLAAFARLTGRIVRFIELLPLDAEGRWHRDLVVPGQRVIDEISAQWPLEPVPSGADHAPSERFRFVDGRGEIGVVRSVTAPFCGRCDRFRLTAEGNLRSCLFSDDEVPLRLLLREDGTDDDLRAALRAAMLAKKAGHGMDDPRFVRPMRSMSAIGG